NYLRLREWRDAHRQLVLIARELQLSVGAKAEGGKDRRVDRAADRNAAGLSTKVDGSGHPPYKGNRTAAQQTKPTTDTKVNVIVREQAEAGEAAQRAKSYAAVHKAILSGLLSQIGQKTEEGDYLGARQRRFWIHPSSVIGRKKPTWVMTAELVETTKVFARRVAKIEPDWIEPLAGHLIKKNHFEPHWEKRRGQVVAFEQVTLYGLIVVGRRPVHFGPVDPVASR